MIHFEQIREQMKEQYEKDFLLKLPDKPSKKLSTMLL